MARTLTVLSVLFLAVRTLTVACYRDTFYSYGMIAGQFAIAEAAYSGHAFAQDAVLASAAMERAKRERRFVPIEEWTTLRRSGSYTTFPAQDLPGLGYLIAATSRWFGGQLTSRYALTAQILTELASLLVFVGCVASAFGQRIAFLTGAVYVLAYPFAWPIASQPARDIFALANYALLIGAWFLFVRASGARSLLGCATLTALASVLLWVRPTGYYFGAALAFPAFTARGRSVRAKAAFVAILLAVPWLTFGYPYKRFNMRHYGTEDPDFLGRVLWAHMGIIKDNPYGFVQRDDALVPWIKEHYGLDVEYGSPQMNRLLGAYAKGVVRRDPVYFVRTVLKRAIDMGRTPLDLVPPFPVAELSGSGLGMLEYAQRHPGSFLYKVVNRAVIAVFFYGGVLFTAKLAREARARWCELAVLISPLAYTIAVQLPTAFEQRYMATGAWVLVLPWAYGIEEWLKRRSDASGVATQLRPGV